MKELADGRCVAFLNRGETELDMTIKWSETGLSAKSMVVRDLWQHKDLGTFSNSFSTSVAGHSVVVLKIHSR